MIKFMDLLKETMPVSSGKYLFAFHKYLFAKFVGEKYIYFRYIDDLTVFGINFSCKKIIDIYPELS